MPTPYLDSKYYCEIQATGVTVDGTNVPWMMSEGKAIEDLVELCYRSDGGDFVICDEDGDLIPFDRFQFDRTAKTIGIVYRDPSQSASTGKGTKLYAWCGGSTVNVASSVDTWKDNYDGAIDHALVVHGENGSANLTDATGNYTATDANITYAQTGKVKKAPEFNGSNSNSNFGDITQINNAEKMTFMGFFSQDALGQTDVIFRKYNGTSLLQLSTESSNLRLYLSQTTNDSAYISDSFLTAGVLSHLVWVYDGTLSGNSNRLKLYADASSKTLSFVGTIPATIPDIGNVFYLGFSSYALDGKIDEFRIVAGALSAAQIADQYNNQAGFDANSTVDVGEVIELPEVYINGIIWTTHSLSGSILPVANNIDGIIYTSNEIIGSIIPVSVPDYIPNVTDRAVNLLKEQFKQATNLIKLLSICTTPLQELEFLIYEMKHIRNLNKTGSILDLNGLLVGAIRKAGQSDAEFKKDIQLKIFTNKSHGEPEVLIIAMKIICQSNMVHYLEFYPAGYQLQCTTDIHPPGNIQSMLELISPAAVFVQLTYSFGTEDKIFSFGDEGSHRVPQEAGGFDEYDYEEEVLTKGKFVELI